MRRQCARNRSALGRGWGSSSLPPCNGGGRGGARVGASWGAGGRGTRQVELCRFVCGRAVGQQAPRGCVRGWLNRGSADGSPGAGGCRMAAAAVGVVWLMLTAGTASGARHSSVLCPWPAHWPWLRCAVVGRHVVNPSSSFTMITGAGGAGGGRRAAWSNGTPTRAGGGPPSAPQHACRWGRLVSGVRPAAGPWEGAGRGPLFVRRLL
jgi:hypothetical protein